MTIQTIALSSIEAGNRLRALDPSWVELLADEIGADGLLEPIRVVERGDRHLLVAGARRLAAAQSLGWKDIRAVVIPAGELADEASVRLAEIKADMMRGDLTVLDRARYTAAWRDIYVSTHEISKGGRKRRDATPEELEELSARFALSFSEAAQKALQISRRSLFDALKIASIDGQVVERKGDLPRVEQMILGAFMNQTVDCPVKGEMARNVCLKWQDKPFAVTSSDRTRMYHACRAGCPHSKHGAE